MYTVTKIETDVQTNLSQITIGELEDISGNVISERVLLVKANDSSETDPQLLTTLAESKDWSNTEKGVIYYIGVNESVHKLPAQPDKMHVWDWSQFAWVDPRSTQEKHDQAAEQIRIKRTKLLQSSDWTQLQDIPYATQLAWVDYRQELRDIPLQSGFPFNVTWPEQPN
jgi:hypothetical protein